MRRNLFLYLALACFLGLLVVFVIDGYLGIYDTLYVRAGEQPFTIEPDFWQRAGRVYSPGLRKPDVDAYPIYSNRGDKIFFRYEIDNRQFSSYEAEVEVSVWRSQEKIDDLLSQAVSVAAFDKGEWQWELNNSDFVPADILPEQHYQYTLSIKRREVERRIIINVNPSPYPAKPGIMIPALPPVQ